MGKRPRTVYSITDAGREVLREWLGTPVSPFAMDFEAMIRLFIAPLGTKEQIIATLQQVRSDAEEMLAFSGACRPTGRTTAASRSWPGSRRHPLASTRIAHRCRLEPSGDGDPLGKEIQSSGVSDVTQSASSAV